jgi:hypothetical protein
MSQSPKFKGTDNPRHLRVIQALLGRPRTREQIDEIAGASNGPELIAELRRRGLDCPCERVIVLDMDGKEVKRGVYQLAPSDRSLIFAWMRRRDAGAVDAAPKPEKEKQK